MATTIDQQVALDEALVPSTQRLRIGRSNFRLPYDIQSKESTLQVVYDVLRSLPSLDETELIGITLEMMFCSLQSMCKAYKEYYAYATGEAAPKLKASAKKKKGDSASSTTPPTPTPTTTVVSTPRLSATAKGKQPARAITPTEPTDVERTKAGQLKIALKRSKQETHVSQQRG
nr:hypothetical protein [Tanacetum cinerariifolium]